MKCLLKSDHSEQQQQPADAGGEQKMETAEVATSVSVVESMEVDEDNNGVTPSAALTPPGSLSI